MTACEGYGMMFNLMILMSCFIYVFSFFVQIKGVFLTFNIAHLIKTLRKYEHFLCPSHVVSLLTGFDCSPVGTNVAILFLFRLTYPSQKTAAMLRALLFISRLFDDVFGVKHLPTTVLRKPSAGTNSFTKITFLFGMVEPKC